MQSERKPDHVWEDDQPRMEYCLNKIAELYDKGDNKVGNHELNLRSDQMGKGACFRAFGCLFKYIDQINSGVPMNLRQATRDNLNVLLADMEHSLDTLLGYSSEQKQKVIYHLKLNYVILLSYHGVLLCNEEESHDN